MMRFSCAVSKLAAGKTLHSAGVCVLVLLTALLLNAPPAGALPPASGSKCKPDWVNNPDAMACFTQGEEDVRNGVAHPHYVACTAAGEIFCCVDNDHGGQDCDAVKTSGGGHQHIGPTQVGAILEAQQTMFAAMSRMSVKVDKLETQLRELNRKCSPPGSAAP
jgi:hypothetical protein